MKRNTVVDIFAVFDLFFAAVILASAVMLFIVLIPGIVDFMGTELLPRVLISLLAVSALIIWSVVLYFAHLIAGSFPIIPIFIATFLRLTSLNFVLLPVFYTVIIYFFAFLPGFRKQFKH